MSRAQRRLAVFSALLLAVACESQEGCNPAEPSVLPQASEFQVIEEPVVIMAPIPVAPIGGAVTSDVRPMFTVVNAERSGPVDSLTYRFEVATQSTFDLPVAAATTPEQARRTGFQPTEGLEFDTIYFWRSQAFDSTTTGAWSFAQVFVTPEDPSAPPGGGGGGGGGVPGYPTNGPDVVAYVERMYPEYLVNGISLDQRIANMEFLRDKVIEVGRCGGMDLAWNLKRGVGPRSTDAIAWRSALFTRVVDIASAFDDPSITLRLQWIFVGGAPGYDPYPPVTCE